MARSGVCHTVLLDILELDDFRMEVHLLSCASILSHCGVQVSISHSLAFARLTG